MKKRYNPKPIDTSGIELSPELLELTEQIATNVHVVWAAGRIAEGWTYGKERNDSLKEHPSLLPYEELTESEKDYDRNTAIGTLKLIIKFGFDITKAHNNYETDTEKVRHFYQLSQR